MTPGIYAQELLQYVLQTSEHYKVTHVTTHKVAKINFTFPTFIANFMTIKEFITKWKIIYYDKIAELACHKVSNMYDPDQMNRRKFQIKLDQPDLS